jgi:hypothetical protein
MSTETSQHLLMYCLTPLWIAVGFADWLCHRRSDIEHTAGPKESLIHLLMFVEVGLPLLAALFLDINALVIGVMLLAFLLHEATALWDVNYAVSKREVSPWEQHMHSFLEMIPLMAIVLVSLIHQDQFAALFGRGDEAPRFELRWKAQPMPTGYLLALFTGIALFSALPYVNELWRGIKARQESPAG